VTEQVVPVDERGWQELDDAQLERWLRETDPRLLQKLWEAADRTRRAYVGDEVHCRGLVELSSHCRRGCLYCGLAVSNRGLERYRMSDEDVLACAERMRRAGCGSIVLQGGEDPCLDTDRVSTLVRRIKTTTELAVTLSLGEREPEELWSWRQAGADRYLLRFETSEADLYATLHPPFAPGALSRLALLEVLRRTGYEVGSGVMVGLPGQSYRSLVRDLRLFRELDLDMIGLGPFIPHPATPLGGLIPRAGDVPGDATMTCKLYALARLLCPFSNLPSTTALGTLDPAEGRELGLRRGANVLMPNFTPPAFRERYRIYPGKTDGSTIPLTREGLETWLGERGRKLGTGPGSRRRRG